MQATETMAASCPFQPTPVPVVVEKAPLPLPLSNMPPLAAQVVILNLRQFLGHL
jgi:hypothetical protein